MGKNKFFYFFAVILPLNIITVPLAGQSFTIQVDENEKTDTLGSEMVFKFAVQNISERDLTLYFVRRVKILPEYWTTSFCFYNLCFPPEWDSVVTNSDFNESPLSPGEVRTLSFKVYPLINEGVAIVDIVSADFNFPSDSVVIELTASAALTGLQSEQNKQVFRLSQNYPNPCLVGGQAFNPSTTIKYSIAKPGMVNLKVFDMLGREVAELVDKIQNKGEYEIPFEPSDLSTGVYIYRLQSGKFVKSKKMLLVR